MKGSERACRILRPVQTDVGRVLDGRTDDSSGLIRERRGYWKREAGGEAVGRDGDGRKKLLRK